MKLDDILQALPTREDIANAVGLQTRSSVSADVLSAFGIFGAGMLLGAGLALLFAPKPGRQTRHDIAEKVGELGSHLRPPAAQPATTAKA